ncbi:hexose carrier protein [Phaffia rhodozyma]|uniref:Hexose carrier protein n=1 Tax=Phaffia rhodozyma TaxID=264483 RepID=A0A0F7SP73_PHARH|nr:hexose carrier protein [Phaffia rhodozyma]
MSSGASSPTQEKKNMQLSARNPREQQPNTDPKRWMGLRGNKLVNAITVTATMGFLLFGYDQGVMSGIINAKQFGTDFYQVRSSGADDEFHATIQGTVTAVYEVGCFFGAIFAFFFGESLGRRNMMWLGSFVMVIGTIIQVTAFGPHKGFLQFMIGRIVTGLGNGANTSTIPSWVAETSKSHNRGFLICVEASMVAVGTLIAYWIDFGLSYIDNSVSWRLPIALQVIFAIFLSAGVAVLPESPRWLFIHGHYDAACQIIADLNGHELEDEDTQRQIAIIVEGINAASGAQTGASFSELFVGGKKQHFRRMAVGASSQIFQQLGGCNAVIYYATVLFENSIGLETRLALVLGGVLSVVYALAALSSFFLVERVGRRKMFLAGSAGQCLAMVITFACLIPGTAQAAKGAAFGLFLYIVFFGSCWLPLPWLYPAELNPLRIRTKANAVSTMSNWLFNFLVVQVTPTMTATIGWGTFLIFACANALFIPVIYFFYPETQGRTLEAIDVIFAQAYEEKARPTHVAKRMPTLTDIQVAEMTTKLDIHGNNGSDVESTAVHARAPTFGDEVAEDAAASNTVSS